MVQTKKYMRTFAGKYYFLAGDANPRTKIEAQSEARYLKGKGVKKVRVVRDKKGYYVYGRI